MYFFGLRKYAINRFEKSDLNIISCVLFHTANIYIIHGNKKLKSLNKEPRPIRQ